ncbi:hypothetical protein CASFOL_014265 [Castilleja foliolosa]|uniref:Uncharacterized protein n=1 Tax=Castilleja foliolosa TaxID=1961234 RepID=A0ABD3DRH0_9LAMI
MVETRSTSPVLPPSLLVIHLTLSRSFHFIEPIIQWLMHFVGMAFEAHLFLECNHVFPEKAVVTEMKYGMPQPLANNSFSNFCWSSYQLYIMPIRAGKGGYSEEAGRHCQEASLEMQS